MKRIFKKYLNSTCAPDEYFSLIEFVGRQENDHALDEYMKDHWDSEEPRYEEIPNDNLLGKIHHQIALKENKSSQNTIRLYKISLRIAAVLLVGLIVGLAVGYRYSSLSGFQKVSQRFSTPAGAKANFQLPDGSMVWLNSSSEISYSGNFEKNRKVYLKGEAYFDVKKSGETFQINTEYGEIRVLGTSFDVKAYSEDDFITTLERGSLEVRAKSGNEKFILKPGNQAFFDENNHLRIKEVDIREFISWKDGQLVFVRKSLDEVVEMLERWYNIDIELDAKENKELWFTGTIEMETISEVLEIIGTTLPIQYSFDSKTRIMKIKAK